MSEHDQQCAFFAWAEMQKIPGIELLHATPNGGLRTKATAGKLKAEGVKAGVPDVSWPVAHGGFIGLAIEFKNISANDGGSYSTSQAKRISSLQKEGWCVVICWDWTSAARLLQGYAGMIKVKVSPV